MLEKLEDAQKKAIDINIRLSVLPQWIYSLIYSYERGEFTSEGEKLLIEGILNHVDEVWEMSEELVAFCGRLGLKAS